MESKGNTRSGNKPDAKIASSGKPEKPTTTDKKETPPKEQPAPAATTPAKKVPVSAANEAAVVNSHSNVKPSPAAAAATEGPEGGSHPADSEHKENNAEESPGSSIFENMKPLIIVGGAAVAVIAVIVGVAVLARKK
uniref:cell cycle exit and neuronal differentiation protein 1 n=1 Tax=Euleptes europaea TaxID=460621 RepID=UPI0025417C2B|nr:cell cycle exit and neuronal differentiation protein 1 [Euleptes europaea]